MPQPKIGAVYAVWPRSLNTVFANDGRHLKVPVRVLSRTEWSIPKAHGDVQEHQAMSSARFRRDLVDRDASICYGLLVCWAEGEPRKIGDPGPNAASGPEAVERLRALAKPDLSHYSEFRPVLREARMHLDVVFADDLTDLIPEEN